MASKNLEESWKHTAGLLLDARSRLSQSAESEFSSDIAQFHEFIDHNELELALDTLDGIYTDSQRESHDILELLARAAKSIGLLNRHHDFISALARARGRDMQVFWVAPNNSFKPTPLRGAA